MRVNGTLIVSICYGNVTRLLKSVKLRDIIPPVGRETIKGDNMNTIRKHVIKLTALVIMSMGLLSLPVSAKTYTTTVTLTTSTSSRSKSVSVGNKLKIRLVYDDFVLLNSNAVFNSSNSSVATVSSAGFITPRKAGSAVILARYKGRSAKIRLTVKGGSSGSSTSSLRSQIVTYAKSFVGKLRYVYGGDSLVYGTDCSGFVHLIYEHFGISTPRTAASFQSMSNITRSQLQPGDLVTYRYGGHVAMYIGNGQVVHAKGTNYGTVIDNIDYGTPTGYVRILG